MIETIQYLINKLWFWYASKIMKWNYVLIAQNKEQTEIIQISFTNNIGLAMDAERTTREFIKNNNI